MIPYERFDQNNGQDGDGGDFHNSIQSPTSPSSRIELEHNIRRQAYINRPTYRPPQSARQHDSDGNVIEKKEIDVDLDDLEETEAESGGMGPLLKDYQESNSTIRRDYTTIDWYWTRHHLGRIRRLIRITNSARGWKGKALNLWYALQGWLILFLVGLATGASAGAIHIVSDWLSGFKEGYCKGQSTFTNRRDCCIEAQTMADCTWTTWDVAILGNTDSASAYWFNYFMYLLVALPMAVLASYYVKVYSRAAARSGISEVKTILGGFIIKKFLGIRTIFIKALGSILAVSAGLSIGKLGAIMHIACCWGNIISRKFKKYNANEVIKREILSASAAAGVAAAFGAPIGGVLFSMESLSSYFPPNTMWRSFWCSITASVLLQYIDPFQTGKLVQFAVFANANHWSWREMPIFAAIGVIGGILGVGFIKCNIKVLTWRRDWKWLRSHPVLDVVTLILLTSVLNYSNFFLRGSQSSLLAQLFTNCRDVSVVDGFTIFDEVTRSLCDTSTYGRSMALLVLAAFTRFGLTVITYGCNVPGGVFMPVLVIGACIGRSIGWALDNQHIDDGDTGFFDYCAGKTSCISAGLYAIIGSASMLAGVTRLTVSLTVILFEITGGLEYIAPVMICIICAKWVGDAIQPGGLYTHKIALTGFPWIDPHAETDSQKDAKDLMSPNPVCLTVYGETVGSVKSLLATLPFHGFPIVDNTRDQLVYGYIARSDLEVLLDQNFSSVHDNEGMAVHFSHDAPPFAQPSFLDLSSHVDKYPIKLLPHTPIDRVLQLFQGLGLRYLLITSHRGQLTGIVKKKDLLLAIRVDSGEMRRLGI